MGDFFVPFITFSYSFRRGVPPTYPFTAFSDHKDTERVHNNWYKFGKRRTRDSFAGLLGQTSRAVRIDYASTMITNKKESDP